MRAAPAGRLPGRPRDAAHVPREHVKGPAQADRWGITDPNCNRGDCFPESHSGEESRGFDPTTKLTERVTSLKRG